VHAHHGLSAQAIEQIVPRLSVRILFWLDAHYSGEGNAMSFNNPQAPDAITAIREELSAIKKCAIFDCVILINDIRGFGTRVNDVEYLGCWAHPSMQEVCVALHEINPNFEFALLGDMFLAYDATRFHPQFSPIVTACTKTRLYDGYTLTDEQLLNYEQRIMHAQTYEKEFIAQMYHRMTGYQDPMFWHDLWYGLVLLGSKQLQPPQEAFYKVLQRTQHFNKNREVEDIILLYQHERLAMYLQACNA